MADSKISALPASTTPLVGTEVVPIVQSGTTKNVSVNDLTAGKAVPGSSFVVNSRTVWGVASAYDPPGPTGNDVGFAFGGGPSVIPVDGSGNATNGIASLGLPSYKWGTIYTGDNVVIGNAAKGVNFTANTPAAGMTSQLLNWYEEGTWTPGQGGGVTVVGSYSSSGTYTRIGRQVTVNFKVSGSTSIAVNSGSSFITGLPFSGSSGVYFVGSCVNGTATLSTNPFVLGSTIYSAEAILAVADIYGTITYTV